MGKDRIRNKGRRGSHRWFDNMRQARLEERRDGGADDAQGRQSRWEEIRRVKRDRNKTGALDGLQIRKTLPHSVRYKHSKAKSLKRLTLTICNRKNTIQGQRLTRKRPWAGALTLTTGLQWGTSVRRPLHELRSGVEFKTPVHPAVIQQSLPLLVVATNCPFTRADRR